MAKVLIGHIKGDKGDAGVYVGSGEMPEGYSFQIDTTDDKKANPQMYGSIKVKMSDFKEEGKPDSLCIDEMLKFASGFKKKVVVIDTDINIDKAILLQSDTTVYIKDCMIKQNNFVFDNVFRGANVELPEDKLLDIEYQHNGLKCTEDGGDETLSNLENNRARTAYVKKTKGMTIASAGDYVFYVCEYDESKNYIMTINPVVGPTWATGYTASSDGGYIRMCIKKTDNSDIDLKDLNKFISINKKMDYLSVPEDIEKLSDIRIIGIGNAVIEGCDTQRKYDENGTLKAMLGDKYGARTHQIDFCCVENLEISDIAFKWTRGWCIELEYVTGFKISGLNINSDLIPNGDGIDVRAGCRDGVIEDIDGVFGDDIIAFNTHVKVGQTYPIMQNGSEVYHFPNEYSYLYNQKLFQVDKDSGDIENIRVNNIRKKDGQYHAIVVLAMFGHKIKNISISNVDIRGNVALPWTNSYIAFYNYIASNMLGDQEVQATASDFTVGDVSNIRLNNVVSDATTNGVVIYSNYGLKDVWANKIEQKNSSAELLSLSSSDGFTITNS